MLATSAMIEPVSLRAQSERRTFTIQIENDAFANSDKG
jgi:hypothetical protein